MTSRSLLLASAIVLVSGASIGLLSAGGNVSELAEVMMARSTTLGPDQQRANLAEDVRVDLLNREAHAGPKSDAFSARGWQPAPPPPPPVRAKPTPPPPAAPALPFTFMGKLEVPGEKTLYYLIEGDKLHAVTEGETINGTHRIDAVNDNIMGITYLPLSIKQTLALGATP